MNTGLPRGRHRVRWSQARCKWPSYNDSKEETTSTVFGREQMRGKVRKENLELHGTSSRKICNRNWVANESKEAREEEIEPEGWEYKI